MNHALDSVGSTSVKCRMDNTRLEWLHLWRKERGQSLGTIVRRLLEERIDQIVEEEKAKK